MSSGDQLSPDYDKLERLLAVARAAAAVLPDYRAAVEFLAEEGCDYEYDESEPLLEALERALAACPEIAAELSLALPGAGLLSHRMLRGGP